MHSSCLNGAAAFHDNIWCKAYPLGEQVLRWNRLTPLSYLSSITFCCSCGIWPFCCIVVCICHSHLIFYRSTMTPFLSASAAEFFLCPVLCIRVFSLPLIVPSSVSVSRPTCCRPTLPHVSYNEHCYHDSSNTRWMLNEAWRTHHTTRCKIISIAIVSVVRCQSVRCHHWIDYAIFQIHIQFKSIQTFQISTPS